MNAARFATSQGHQRTTLPAETVFDGGIDIKPPRGAASDCSKVEAGQCAPDPGLMAFT